MDHWCSSVYSEKSVFDRIKLVESRFALIKREAEIAYLRELLHCNGKDKDEQLRHNYASSVVFLGIKGVDYQ